MRRNKIKKVENKEKSCLFESISDNDIVLRDYESYDEKNCEEEEENEDDKEFIDDKPLNEESFQLKNNSIMSENILLKKIDKKIDAKTLGVVIYMDKEKYSENVNDNLNIHFEVTKEQILLCLFYVLLEEINDKNVNEAIIAHEHGEKNKKCHMQIYIKFNDRIQKKIKPGSFIYKNNTYLYIVQSAKNPNALKNYCKKNGDYLEIKYESSISNILFNDKKINKSEVIISKRLYNVLINKDNLSNDDIINIFKNGKNNEKRDFFLYGDKICNNYDLYIKKKKDNIEFKWLFPEYIISFLSSIQNETYENSKLLRIYKVLYAWFKEYCEPEISRRKALFLFSIEGNKGKSYFARNLVPQITEGDSPYYVYCRGTLDGKEFDKKKQTARLIIIDDVNYINKDIEIWKALSVGEATNIRTPYYNDLWNKSLPCVIMSNSIQTLKYWLNDPSLNTRCVFLSIDTYIGPPNTYVSAHDKIDQYLDNNLLNKLFDN